MDFDIEGKLIVKKDNKFIIVDSKDNEDMDEEIDLEKNDLFEESEDVYLFDNDKKEKYKKKKKIMKNKRSRSNSSLGEEAEEY